MAYRNAFATYGIVAARMFGRAMGCQVVVETSEHSIELTMEVPDQETRAWDPHQFKHGQMYVKGYANPVKPKVRQHTELEEPDTVDVKESSEESRQVAADGGENEHVQLISSPRYQSYMRQDLIAQLLNPSAQWKLIVYAVIGLAGLALINTMILLNVAGVF